MIKILISLAIIQMSVVFAATAAAGGTGGVSHFTAAAVVASSNSVAQTYSPLEQKVLLVFNSAYALFEGKTFREMDDKVDRVRKEKFTQDFMGTIDPVFRFSLFEGLMKDGFIDGFDRALILLQRVNSSLAKYMVPFCILARTQGEKPSYTIPECVMSYVLNQFSGNNPEDFRQYFTKDVLYTIFQALTLGIFQTDKQFTRTLSPYFAYVMNVRSNQFSKMALQYAACLGNNQINHQASGEVFLDFLTAEKFATYVYYRQIDLYKKLSPTEKVINRGHFETALENFALVFDTKKLEMNPQTKQKFLSDADYYKFLKSFLGEFIYLYPKLVIRLEFDPRKKINILCAKLDVLESDDLMFLAQQEESHNHPFIIEKAAQLFNKSNPSILEQKAFLWKKAYDQNDPKFSNQALMGLCFNCMERNDATLLPGYNGNTVLTIIHALTLIVEEKRLDSNLYGALLALKEFRDFLGYQLDEYLNKLISDKLSPENPEYHNLFRMIDAQRLVGNPLFFDLDYLERLLKPVIEDQELAIQAYQMLYDLSLKTYNMEKAYDYAGKLHEKTTYHIKAFWGETKKALQRYLNPSRSCVQKEDSEEAEVKALQLLAEQEAQEKAERRAWVEKQLELRHLYKKQHPEEEVPNSFGLKHLPPLRFTIKEDTKVATDLEKFEHLEALRTNYNIVLDSLRVGKIPSGSSKYAGISVTVSNKEYALWHCRLNDEHRVFYYKIGTDVFVIQAFGHDLNESRLPH